MGSWTPGDFQGGDSILDAGTPDNETVKLAYVQPVAGSVPSGTQKALQVNWQVTNFAGVGTTASSTVRIDGTGSGGTNDCLLGPSDFTTTQSGYAYPRIYAPTSSGCGYQIELDYTITLESGQVTAQELSTIESNSSFIAFDNTLEGNEHAKVIVVYPTDGILATTQPVILRVNWIAANGDALFASPGHSLVTINPD